MQCQYMWAILYNDCSAEKYIYIHIMTYILIFYLEMVLFFLCF